MTIPTPPTERRRDVNAHSSAPVPATDVLRIEKGAPTEEELAAVAVALLAATTRPTDDTETPSRARARWRRMDRAFGHHTPRSWRSEAWRVSRKAGEGA
ncbi:acyl-CoA carboxylase epsilon subunit [Kitasatospora sp. NPDC056531]|uniref:acyl-CoA carboxylase epsilon subunit n=1 Tax=Kitasatospora sp. NPDC056531 TaxID=3345856 RepID=UPI003690C4BE